MYFVAWDLNVLWIFVVWILEFPSVPEELCPICTGKALSLLIRQIEEVSQQDWNDDRQVYPNLVTCHPVHGKMSGDTLCLQKRRKQVIFTAIEIVIAILTVIVTILSCRRGGGSQRHLESDFSNVANFFSNSLSRGPREGFEKQKSSEFNPQNDEQVKSSPPVKVCLHGTGCFDSSTVLFPLSMAIPP